MPLIPRAAAPLSKTRPATILSVGRRAYVNCRGRVSLALDDGRNSPNSLADGAEVEILAWRPRRSGATLYRVRPTAGGTEGWLNGASMKPRPALPVQKVQSIAAARRQPPPKDVASKTVKRPTRAKTVR